MGKLYLLNVFPPGYGKEIYRKIEICGNSTLNDLCEAILDSLEFDYDHAYEFCMNNKMYRGGVCYQSHPEFDEPSCEIALDDIGLIKEQKFLFHYDFGEDWAFTVSVNKIAETKETFPPRVVKSLGSIQQYQDDDEDYDDEYDEEEWDED